MDLQSAARNENGEPRPEDAGAVECAKSVRKWLKRLNDVMGDGGVASVTRDDVIIARERLLRYCEELLKFPKFRRQALDTLWTNCWYGPVKIYRSAAASAGDDHVHWLKTFISCAVGHLSYLTEKYVDLRLTLFIYTGDLNRYRYQVCGNNQTDFDLAVASYEKASRMYPTEGNPIHQLALLHCDKDNRKAMRLFLRSLLTEHPVKKAVENLKAMKPDQLGDIDRTVFELTPCLLSPFNRIQCDEHKEKLEEILRNAVDDSVPDDLTSSLYSISLVSIHILNSEDMEEQSRYVTTFVCGMWQSLLGSYASKARTRNSPKQPAARRRRRRRISEESDENDAGDGSSSDNNRRASDSDSDQEDEARFAEAVVVLTVVSEWLSRVSEKFTAKKVSVAIRVQYQGLVQTFVDTLNKFLRNVAPLMTKATNTPSIVPIWTTKAPLLDTAVARLAALQHFLLQCVEGLEVPIVFDRFFKVASGQSKELQMMKSISRVHSEHVNKEQAHKSALPVYVMPDQQVLVERLSLVKHLVDNQTVVVIVRGIFAGLDRIKKDNLPVRNAIRWLETELKQGRIKVAEVADTEMFACAEKFLEEKGIKGQQSLFLTILVMDKEPRASGNPAISIENAEQYRDRWAKHRQMDRTAAGPS